MSGKRSELHEGEFVLRFEQGARSLCITWVPDDPDKSPARTTYEFGVEFDPDCFVRCYNGCVAEPATPPECFIRCLVQCRKPQR